MAESNHNGTWTLSHREYQELKNQAEFMLALEAAGLYEWDGYAEAQARYDAGDF